MEIATMWWIFAGVAVGVELFTGTFYLLMLALGMAAGAIGAHMGWGLSAQLVLAAFVGGGAVGAWSLHRARTRGTGSGDNPDLHLDIGETVCVDAWRDDATATVRYRGASWGAVRATGSPEGTGPHCVRGMSSNRLVLEKI